MKDGVVCEEGDAERVFEHPQSPYTQALLAAIPVLPGERMPDEVAHPVTQ
jgi:oligopeptide/dipeptide ABC transporter ATP-binding protein